MTVVDHVSPWLTPSRALATRIQDHDGAHISNNGTGVAPDAITDFQAGVDLLVIDLVAFGIDPVALGLMSSGTVSSSAFVKGVGIRPLDPNDHYLLDTAQGMLRFDPDGTGPQTAIDLVKFVGVVDKDFASSDIYIAI